MDLGFRGEVADFYQRYRHGYPEPVIDALARLTGLGPADVAVDLGCGTGQLTLPVARRARAVIGIDPEPDMLRRAQSVASDAGLANVTWLLGSDADLPAVGALAGAGSVAAVTVAQALHWMNDRDVFAAARPLLRPGGGMVVVTNGIPLWLQDTEWSRALRGFLERWLGHPVTAPCGTDEASQQRYREHLAAAGYDVASAAVDYDVKLTLDGVVGGVFSALAVQQLPDPDERPGFARQVREVLPAQSRFPEHVRVSLLAGLAR